jgi:SAM-dependent methyltransferase
MPALTELLTQWQEDLAAWAIPAYLTAAVPDSPWVLPRQVFARRADRLRQAPAGPSYQREWQALDPPGSVLDVGAGAGAACLPLTPRTTTLTAVDTDRALLDLLAERARAAGLEPRLLAGGWPEVATQTAPVDVVTCHNVLYNVPDLGPFIEALTAHARRQVVLELTAAHPLTSLNPLWRHFHGLDRPAGPTAGHVLAILDAMGLRAGHTEWNRPAEADYATVRELADVTRRRLCLPAERTAEVEAALRDTAFRDTVFRETGLSGGQSTDLGTAGRAVVTIWWEGSA